MVKEEVEEEIEEEERKTTHKSNMDTLPDTNGDSYHLAVFFSLFPIFFLLLSLAEVLALLQLYCNQTNYDERERKRKRKWKPYSSANSKLD